MKIGILGTRGIPNRYGGFEQFAEIVSQIWNKEGHEVWVYCCHNHDYTLDDFEDVHRIMIFDPEFAIGTAGQFFYDLGCILDSRKRNFDILLQLGYTSSSIWSFLLPSTARIISNMDGLEWTRSKYSKGVQRFLRYAEKLAVKNSDVLVADSIGIQKYLCDKYQKDSIFIAYGADIPELPDPESMLESFQVQAHSYNLIIARMEPENNIEMILKGMVLAGYPRTTIVVGNTGNAFGTYLKKKYENSFIRFTGGIYNKTHLDVLRQHCYLYYHGHSVGGTNPSLLEAMAVGALISAHRNAFNSSVLDDEALYFSSDKEVADQQTQILKIDRKKTSAHLIQKIRDRYSWQFIAEEYLEVFRNSLKMSVSEKKIEL